MNNAVEKIQTAYSLHPIETLYLKFKMFMWSLFVDTGFCPPWSHSSSVPKKHTGAYVSYKLVGLLAQDFY